MMSSPAKGLEVAVFNPWTRHYQAAWENRAADARLPLWLRASCLAYGRHEANGHARFVRGQLAVILGEPFQKVPRQRVQDAIRLAVQYGWLQQESRSECLVVPAYAIEGPSGNPRAECLVHELRR